MYPAKRLILILLAASCLLAEVSYASMEALRHPRLDSLEHLLTEAGNARAQLILEELILLYLPENPQLALQKSRQALALAEKHQNYKAQAFALSQIGNSLRLLLSDYDSALYYCSQALALSKEHQLQEEQISTLFISGDVYQELGNNYKAIQDYMQAQLLAESRGLQPAVAEALNSTGRIYANIGNENKAIEKHARALQISQQVHYHKGIADSHFYLGIAYQHKGELQLALQRFQLAADIRQQMNDPAGIGHCELAQARIYLDQAAYDMSELKLNHAMGRFQQLGMSAEQAQVYNTRGRLLMAQKKHQQALPHLQAALQIGEMRNDKKIIRDSYENLYACYSTLQNYEQALKYKDLFVAISDFIYGEENERRMAEQQTRFEIAEKEREIAVLKIDNELRALAGQKEGNFRNFLITAMVLLLIILLLIVYLYHNKQQSNRQLQQTNQTINAQNRELQALIGTKDKFFSIISHDLKGPLNSLTAFSGLLINHADALSREEIQMLATDLDKSVKNLLSLLENLLEWSRAQNNQLEVAPEALALLPLVQTNAELLQQMADNKKILIHINVDDQLMAFAGKNQLNAVLRNLISNALKFTETGGRVTISARELGDMLEVAIQDTGVGISEEVMDRLFKPEHKHSSPGTANEKGTGLGLMLCKEFIEQNGGHLSVESKEGIGSTFRFSIAKAGHTKAAKFTAASTA